MTAQTPKKNEPRIGDKMPDGTVYAGVSRDTGKAMYAMPADAPLSMKFNEAQTYAMNLDAHGHRDWRVPSKEELSVFFNNRAAIGGFNVIGSPADGCYWSSSESNARVHPWSQCFTDGYQDTHHEDFPSSVRCVR